MKNKKETFYVKMCGLKKFENKRYKVIEYNASKCHVVKELKSEME